MRDYVIRCSASELIGRSRASYLLPYCLCVFPLLPLRLSHVPSSHLRSWKGPHRRRLPRPRPRLLWRRRLHLLSLLYCYSSREHKPHRRQITTVHQRHLVIHLVYLWDHRAAFHCSISGRKVPRLPSTRRLPFFLIPAYYHISSDASKNKFVHLALQKTLSLALEAKGPAELEQALGAGLDVTIVGDNDFYSQQDQARIPSPIPHALAGLKRPSTFLQLKSRNLPVSMASLAAIPPFSPTGVALADVAKTGLGSSAALITSLVTALLVQAGLIAPGDLASASSRRLAHNVAQFVHCLAQGKVGSGFDVSAAAFGSQFYTRFSPAVLQPLMDDSARVPSSIPLPPCPDPVVACLSFVFFCSAARIRSCQYWRRRTKRGISP